ncbi:hypothetical protein PHISP_07008 [Aspergillus sp. HF37]|nr:hypothetical protein PHISP_07008 [Aspergillus sp. HF37]
MQRVFQRLRGKAKPQLSPEGRQLLILFNQLADERNRLLQDISHALDTINVLETQLAEYDCLLEQAQSRLSGRTDLSKPRISADAHKPQVDSSTELAWIDDTWLCSCQNSALLGEAESRWKAGRPQQALIAASRALSSHPCLELADQLKCGLFIAALVHYGSKYEESNERVDSVLRTIQEQPPANYAQAREVRGIAQFIRGRNLMGLEEWHLAYWLFRRLCIRPGIIPKPSIFRRWLLAIANG